MRIFERPPPAWLLGVFAAGTYLRTVTEPLWRLSASAGGLAVDKSARIRECIGHLGRAFQAPRRRAKLRPSCAASIKITRMFWGCSLSLTVRPG